MHQINQPTTRVEFVGERGVRVVDTFTQAHVTLFTDGTPGSLRETLGAAEARLAAVVKALAERDKAGL